MVNVPAEQEEIILREQPYNAADPKQVNDARKKASRRAKQQLHVIQAMMENEPTRAWLYDFMAACSVFGNPAVLGDTHATYFNLGMQNAGKMILQDVEKFPDLYIKMVQEAKTRK